MIRSRSIPSVLSRVTGDGIHAVLLIDADGELLGSHGSPAPQHPSQVDTGGGATGPAATSSASHNEKNHWPLDAASIGALISEVTGDYRRMGDELQLLDPQYDSQRQSAGKGDGQSRQDRDGVSNGGGVGGGSSSLLQTGSGGKNGKDKHDSGMNLKSLVIELDYVSEIGFSTMFLFHNGLNECVFVETNEQGVVGVASAGPDFYVIALADSTVQHGALTGRLQSLGSHVREALSQLD